MSVRRRFLSEAEYHRWQSDCLARRAVAQDVVLVKAFSAEVGPTRKGDDGVVLYPFVISTAGVDRDNDTLRVDGWLLDNYRKSPVVLWAHQYDELPLGQATEVGIVNGRLRSVVRFDSDISPFASMVERMVERRTLRTASVGFRPVDFTPNEERRGVDFKTQELLEWSIVPVPSNPEALLEAKAAGIDLEPLKAWAERVLDQVADADARRDLEALHKAAGGRTRTVTSGSRRATAAKSVPRDVSRAIGAEGQAWSAPTLNDFTSKAWADLTAAERTRIAGHFAWSDELPPAAFGSLKLPHHNPQGGSVNRRGLIAAAGRLNQTQGIDQGAVRAHLRRHYRDAGMEVPAGLAKDGDGSDGTDGDAGLTCPKCGGDVDAGMAFCPACGAALEQQKAPETKPKPQQGESRDDFVARCIRVVMGDGSAEHPRQAAAMCAAMWDQGQKAIPNTCPKCQSPVEQQDKYCWDCGMPLQGAGKAPSVGGGENTDLCPECNTPIVPGQMRFCPNCGNQLMGGGGQADTGQDPNKPPAGGDIFPPGGTQRPSKGTKRGRVLSAANEGKIRQSIRLLEDVLAQLDTDAGAQTPTSEPNITGTGTGTTSTPDPGGAPALHGPRGTVKGAWWNRAGLDASPGVTRWNPALSKAFDIAEERLEPATKLLALVSRYLGAPVKDLYRTSILIPSAKLSSVLSALDEALARFTVEDVRNIGSFDATERPPVYEHIQLNSTRASDFLIEGQRFLAGARPRKMVLQIAPVWCGAELTCWTTEAEHAAAVEFREGLWTRAAALNFLKGEAFSLSGEFLPRTDETWEDLYLTAANEQAVRRAVTLLNARGLAAPNRGLLLMGPPGTGKTLAARVVRNEAAATFIWVSSRDFYRAGAFGGLTYAFDLARECAPSVLIFEDIDNWLSATSIDLLKTEMDGVGRSTGIVTILTTNSPAAFPDALLDRPGRFHDVLNFALPDSATRQRMLQRWLPSLTDAAALATVIEATEGMSGAHVRELARFTEILQAEDSLDLGVAIEHAIAKVQEQRDLITEVQMAGSRYQPTRALEAAIVKTARRRQTLDAELDFIILDEVKTAEDFIRQTDPMHRAPAGAATTVIDLDALDVRDVRAAVQRALGAVDLKDALHRAVESGLNRLRGRVE